MKERPILFSAPMVLAILDGRKTQTRRIVNGVNPYASRMVEGDFVERFPGASQKDITKHGGQIFTSRGPVFVDRPGSRECEYSWHQCPHGQPGDRLWVRETWRTDTILDDVRPRSMQEGIPIKYECDDEATDIVAFGWGRIRQSIFMRRWMSRITLEITRIRVERLQDISEADAKAEGIEETSVGWKSYEVIHTGPHKGLPHPHSYVDNRSPITSYRELWESINGPGSWDQNPWVWCLEFKRISNQTTP